MKIGEVCPLFFNPVINKFERDIDYIQKFHSTDNIHLQILTYHEEHVEANINNLLSGEIVPILFHDFAIDEFIIRYAVLTNLPDGCYFISITDYEGKTVYSQPFNVSSSDELLKYTTLIKYTHKDNNSIFSNIFWINGVQQIFNFRVEAGFRSDGYIPSVDNEQYRNQRQKIQELYAYPYDKHTLTVGNANGVPYWIIRHINQILCLSDFEIEGKGYTRSENAVPEMEQSLENTQLYHSKIILEEKYKESYYYVFTLDGQTELTINIGIEVVVMEFGMLSKRNGIYQPYFITSPIPYWIHIISNEDYVQMLFEENNTGNDRTSNLVFTQEGSGKTITVNVIQIYPVLNVSPKSIHLSDNGSPGMVVPPTLIIDASGNKYPSL